MKFPRLQIKIHPVNRTINTNTKTEIWYNSDIVNVIRTGKKEKHLNTLER